MPKLRIQFLCSALSLLPVFAIVNPQHPQRPQIDVNIRGNSFGLENYLFSNFDNVDISSSIQNIKKTRPTATMYEASFSDPQTYEIVNPTIEMFSPNRLARPTQSHLNWEYQNRRPELINTFQTNIGEVDTTVQTIPNMHLTHARPILTEASTERNRKRVTMRRRKRPIIQIPIDSINDPAENGIIKPSRISKFPQTPKLVVRTKLPSLQKNQWMNDQEAWIPKTNNATTNQPEIPQEERVFEEEATKASHIFTTRKPAAINLKTFLKQQTGTLSLSELLQTQNLSLSDLLKGNKDPSAILQVRDPITTTEESFSNYRRKTYPRMETTTNIAALPEINQQIIRSEVETEKPKYSTTSNTILNNTEVSKNDHIATKKTKNEETLETPQPIRRKTAFGSNTIGLDAIARMNEFRAKLRNYQKRTQTMLRQAEATPKPKSSQATPTDLTAAQIKTTEKPHYKKNRVPYKSSNNQEPVTSADKKPELTAKRPERVYWSTRLPSKIESESVKQDENNLVSTTKNTVEIPSNFEKQEKIIELSEENNLKGIATTTTTTTTTTATPTKTTIMTSTTKLRTPTTATTTTTTTTTEMTTTTTSTTTTEKPTKEKQIEEISKPEPKDDLFDLLKSEHTADRLQKILRERNMTLEEVLYNRDKSTVHSNIEELFSTPKKEITYSTPPDSEYEDMINMKSSKQFDVQQKIGYDEPVADESKQIISKVLPPLYREPKQYEATAPNQKIETNLKRTEAITAFNDLPAWKFSNSEITEREETKISNPNNDDELTESEVIIFETLQRNKDSNRKFKLNLDNFVTEEETPIVDGLEDSFVPPAIKSAIIASGIVMGIALFVFIAIFAACGYKQRQNRLKGSSSILSDTLTKNGKKPKRGNKSAHANYDGRNSIQRRQTFEDDDTSTSSEISNTGSYIWNTLKNTFVSRRSTLRERFDREEKVRDNKLTLRGNENRRQIKCIDDDTSDLYHVQDERLGIKKVDRDRNVINTSFAFKRSPDNNFDRFDECIHGY